MYRSTQLHVPSRTIVIWYAMIPIFPILCAIALVSIFAFPSPYSNPRTFCRAPASDGAIALNVMEDHTAGYQLYIIHQAPAGVTEYSNNGAFESLPAWLPWPSSKEVSRTLYVEGIGWPRPWLIIRTQSDQIGF